MQRCRLQNTEQLDALFYPQKTLYRKIVFLFLCMATIWMAHGQDFTTRYKRYTTEDGLAHRSVRCLIQDRKGFIWVGTEEGIDRFDGYRFEHYIKAKNGLTQDFVSDIFEDPDGLLWLFYKGVSIGQIDIFDPTTGKALPFQQYFKGRYPAGFPSKLFRYAAIEICLYNFQQQKQPSFNQSSSSNYLVKDALFKGWQLLL